MKAFFKDIFEYHHHFNQKLADQLMKYQNQIPQQVIPLFSHTINAQQIWNARIDGTETLDVHQVHTIQECATLDKKNYINTIDLLDQTPLDKVISYSNSKGITFENSAQQILFHVANHFTHHKGQIIAELRQNGIEPIVTDYIFYKR